jgi:hypothetical protein
MWTKRERVLAVLEGERPDRVPIFECLIHDGVLEHFGGKPLTTGDTEAVIRACSGCLDLCHPVLVPNTPGREEKPDGSLVVTERWTTWSRPPPTTNPAGLVAALDEQIERAEAWEPAGGERDAFIHAARQKDEWAGDMLYIHLGFSCPILPYDLERGSYLYVDHRDLVRRWNHAINRQTLRHLDTVADGQVSPVCILWNDIAAKQHLIYPPAMLEELFYPHLQAQLDLLHSRHIRAVFHSDGDVTSALPRLVECGIDAFNPLEISAGMNPQRFRDLCGSRVALVGGMDAVDVLARGTPELVASRTRDLIDLFRSDGRLMMASASGEVDNSMPLANVLAMYETVWSYGKY